MTTSVWPTQNYQLWLMCQTTCA